MMNEEIKKALWRLYDIVERENRDDLGKIEGYIEGLLDAIKNLQIK